MQGTGETGGRLRLVVFLLEERRHALPLDAVERVLLMVAVSPLAEAPPVVLGAVNVGGAIVPVVDLRPRFAFAPRDYGPSAHLLLVQTPRRRVALAADRVVGIEEVAAAAVTAPADVIPGGGRLAGVATLPDGLVMIHDLDALLSLEEEARLGRALETREG